jgi:hypothetical protein
MTPKTPAASENKAPVAARRQPPEEKFWQHYSPHHEFPLSSITSVALHVLAVVLLAVIGWVLIKLGLGDENKPPDVRAVFVEDAGGGGSKTGVPGSKGAGGNPLPAEDVGPSTEETPKEDVQLKDVDVGKVDPLKLPEIKDDQGRQIIQRSNEAIKRLGSVDAEARSKLFGSVGDKGQGGSGSGGGRGSGEGEGHGPGKGSGKLTQRQKRLLRWSMTFNTQNGEDYLNQLRDIKPGKGAILAVPAGGGRYEVIENLTQRPAKGEVKDIGTIKRISWVDDKPESVAGLSRALGIPAPQYFIAFFPQELETELARLEHDFANRNEDDIEETRFIVERLERAADGYHARVVAQTPKGR